MSRDIDWTDKDLLPAIAEVRDFDKPTDWYDPRPDQIVLLSACVEGRASTNHSTNDAHARAGACSTTRRGGSEHVPSR
jgi:hypothetical protein